MGTSSKGHTHKEGNQTRSLVLFDGFAKGFTPKTEVIVRFQLAHAHLRQQSRAVDRGVGLQDKDCCSMGFCFSVRLVGKMFSSVTAQFVLIITPRTLNFCTTDPANRRSLRRKRKSFQNKIIHRKFSFVGYSSLRIFRVLRACDRFCTNSDDFCPTRL